MIGIVIATHADLGEGILNVIALILGEQPNVRALGLKHGDGIEEFEDNVYKALETADEGEGVIGFVDFLGGSPSNVMMKSMKKKNFQCIAGVNMPMVIETITNRDTQTIEELAENAVLAGTQGFVRLHELYHQMSKTSDDDEI